MGGPTTSIAKAPPAQQYRDDADTDALSLHTTRDDYEYDDAPDLPSYSDSEAAASGADTSILPSDDPPRDEYAVMQLPVSNGWRVNNQNKVVNVKETTLRMDERLNDAAELYLYITTYLRLVPPKPAVRMRGWHYQTVHRKEKKETERVVDFDIMLYLTAYLPTARPADELVVEEGGWRPRIAANSDCVHRGGWRKTRAEGYKQDIEVGSEPRPDLVHWCKDYCDSKATLKIFRVTRDVSGVDHDYLRAQIEPLIRSTNYRGHIDISFPIEEKHVDIYNPHIINKWRISWVRYIFYVTFLWLITWPILFFSTAWWSVYTVNFCFSWQQSNGRGGRKKQYNSITEQAWLSKHANLIKALVLDRYQGDATDLPLGVQSSRRDRDGRTRQTGNANIDSAVNFIQSGVTAWDALSRSTGRDMDGWGADSR
ncbi:hypothetical protein LTR36_010479 [Oleoguttula mirabilis]|uniref:Uncharacterized protein n=1 Tax=Oleoguttula mirabilis TaxID=1507867 RepID=A0AAV9J4X6_9PEZI|nr:hypothetical protein LTR36_010479 [Oleoguttula mirabilis]